MEEERPEADVNLWFAPFDLTQEADRTFYQTCREEAWQTLYGRLDRYDGAGFLEEAYQNWQADPKSLTLAMAGRHRAGLLQLDPGGGTGRRRGTSPSSISPPSSGTTGWGCSSSARP